jgi:hypothetical protein
MWQYGLEVAEKGSKNAEKIHFFKLFQVFSLRLRKKGSNLQQTLDFFIVKV